MCEGRGEDEFGPGEGIMSDFQVWLKRCGLLEADNGVEIETTPSEKH